VTEAARVRSPDSGEVDVVAKTDFAGAFQKSNEGRPLLSTCPSPDDDDDAVMGLPLGQRDEVIAIAGDEQVIPFEREPKHRWVCGLRAEHVADTQNLVLEFANSGLLT
jgi:hypothetical protein